jgi:hypothetical protein
MFEWGQRSLDHENQFRVPSSELGVETSTKSQAPKEKHQFPSTKFQINSNDRNSRSQIPSPPPSPLRGEGGGEGWSLEIGVLNLFGIWDSSFGI